MAIYMWREGGFTPTQDTLLYMPLNDDVTDYSDQHNNGTWSSAGEYWYIGESSNKKCAYINGNQINLATCPIGTGNPGAFTHACWVKTNNAGYSVLHHFGLDSYGRRSLPVIFYTGSHYPINDIYGVDISLGGNASSSLYGSRMRVVYTYDGQGGHQLYINGSLYGTGSGTLNIGNGTFSIGINNSTYKEFWLSECIIENYVWTLQQVQNDYSSSSSEYTELPIKGQNTPHIATDLTNYTTKESVLALGWTDLTTYNSTQYTLANGNGIEITGGGNAVASLCYQLQTPLTTSKTLTLHITGYLGSKCAFDCGLMNAKGDSTYTGARVSGVYGSGIRISGSSASLNNAYGDVDYTVTMNFSTGVITFSGTATQGQTTFSQTATMTSAQIQTTLGYGYIVFQVIGYGTPQTCYISSAEYTIS